MSIFQFITPDELSDLPEDPACAFSELAFLAQKRLGELSKELDPQEEYQWRELSELQHSFLNVVLAAAKRFKIEPFKKMEVPQLSSFGDREHKQFKADLDHYLTQLALDNAIRGKRESVEILPTSKEKIRKYVLGLRTCLENADMTDAKRESLLKRLDQFENELNKRRLSLSEVTILTMTVLGLPGGVWGSVDMVTKLVNNVLQVVAEAKAAEDETRQLPPIEPPKALSPPRQIAPPQMQVASAFDSDLDDDVPF